MRGWASAPRSAEPAFRSLRAQLLTDLGFFTSAAVLVVGVTTALLVSGEWRTAAAPLALLWAGSTLIFAVFGVHLVNRIVLMPLRQLAAEAKVLARGDLSVATPRYESAELDELAGHYREMATELLDVQAHVVRVEKLASIGQLAAGVAHEIRNPLGALAAYVEVLRRREAAPDLAPAMQQAIERIECTVRGLLEYARPGPAGEGCDCNAAVRTAADFLEAQGALRNHELVLALAPGLPVVRAPRHAMEQVVLNLVLNAVQAAPSGVITVGTVARAYDGSDPIRRAADRPDAQAPGPRARMIRPRRPDLPCGTPGVLLYVADNGPGVPDALRERIFDPFFTTKEPGEGTGLGLAITARAVHEAGGVVWVDPARDGGAVFKIFLPGGGDLCAC